MLCMCECTYGTPAGEGWSGVVARLFLWLTIVTGAGWKKRMKGACSNMLHLGQGNSCLPPNTLPCQDFDSLNETLTTVTAATVHVKLQMMISLVRSQAHAPLSVAVENVEDRTMVERPKWMCAYWVSEQQERRHQVTYHTYLTSGGDCHTHRVLNV